MPCPLINKDQNIFSQIKYLETKALVIKSDHESRATRSWGKRKEKMCLKEYAQRASACFNTSQMEISYMWLNVKLELGNQRWTT